jgi:prepilin signal peptidase PulO-like enzyme (type II secretory pathway)
MYVVVSLYIFVVGLAFGSFALAMVDRMKSKRDWVRGRSECDQCMHKLAIRDLVPLFSWLVAGGKCRYCHKKLSPAYPLVEISMGTAFLLSYLYFPFELEGSRILLLVLWLLALVVLGGLFVYDLRWFKLPNKLVYPLIGISAVYRIVYIATTDNSAAGYALGVVGSVAVGAGLFWILHLISKGEWIGDGDVRLGMAMGLLLPGPLEAWLAIFVASTLGLLIALPQARKNKKGLKMKIPFGPVLIVGLFVSYLFGGSVIDWYGRVFLFM